MAKQFSKSNAFLTFVWRFLGSNTLEQVEFKLEKIIEIYPPTCTGKVKSGILLPKLFLPTERINFLVIEKKNEIRGCWPRICKNFEIAKQFVQTVKAQDNFW